MSNYLQSVLNIEQSAELKAECDDLNKLYRSYLRENRGDVWLAWADFINTHAEALESPLVERNIDQARYDAWFNFTELNLSTPTQITDFLRELRRFLVAELHKDEVDSLDGRTYVNGDVWIFKPVLDKRHLVRLVAPMIFKSIWLAVQTDGGPGYKKSEWVDNSDLDNFPSLEQVLDEIKLVEDRLETEGNEKRPLPRNLNVNEHHTSNRPYADRITDGDVKKLKNAFGENWERNLWIYQNMHEMTWAVLVNTLKKLSIKNKWADLRQSQAREVAKRVGEVLGREVPKKPRGRPKKTQT